MKKYGRIDNDKIVEFLETDQDIAELFHPDLIWIEISNNQAVEIGDRYVDGVFSKHAPLSLPPEQEKKAYSEAIQAHLDAAAILHGYDDIRTAVSYAEEPAVPKFQKDGKAFRTWRSLVWAYVYQQLDLVEHGKREKPSIEQLILELPTLVGI